MDAPQATHPSLLQGRRLIRRAANDPIRAAAEYWLGLHDGKSLPEYERLDAAALPHRTLPYLFLLERIPQRRWRVRLMGSHLVAALGRDFTGCDMEDGQIPGISGSRTIRMLEQVVDTGLPGHFHGRSGFRFRDDYADHEQILLPLRRHGGDAVEVVLGAIVYEGLRGGFGPVGDR